MPGPAPASPARRRRARVGRGRSRSRRAVPRRAPRVRARVGGRARTRAQRDRARVPGRQPARERARRSAACAWCWRAWPRCSSRGDRRLVALDQRGNARAEATAAAAQRLGAQALAEDDLDRACCSRARAWRWTTRSQTRSSLLAALLKSPAAIGVLRGDGDRLAGVALSPDDRTLAVIDNDGTLRLVDTGTRRPVARPLTVSGDAGATTPGRA